MKKFTRRKIIATVILVILLIGLVTPQHFTIPVSGAGHNDFNKNSYWYYPWGKSGTHKGVDIFANEGTAVVSPTGGLVLYTGELPLGGNVILMLGPKWRVHYFAHLRSVATHTLAWTSISEMIGSVGTTGNAKGKPPHLHYSMVTLIPYPWRIDGAPQGWKKMFYLNHINYLK